MKKNSRTVKLTLCGLLAALVFVFTFFLPIPNGIGGYICFGDGAIILAGAFLGGPAGAVVGAIGSALADLAGGYAVFAPATFVIKGLMGLLAGLLLHKSKLSAIRVVWVSLLCEAIMVAGYFVFELFLYDVGGALTELLFNLIQMGAGVVIASVFIGILKKLNIADWS